LAQIEEIVNRQVLANEKVDTLVDVPIDVAVNEFHAMALFGEKYGDKVRVVKDWRFLDGALWWHAHARDGRDWLIKLVGEGSVSSGVRRVEAVSGMGALGEFRRDYEVARVVGQIVGSADVQAPAELCVHESPRAKEEMKKLRPRAGCGSDEVGECCGGKKATTVEVKGIKLLVQRVDGLERGPMRDLVDQMRGKLAAVWWCWARLRMVKFR